jgi:putative flippase GtrA
MRDSGPVSGRRWWRQFVAFAGVGVVATGIQYGVLLFAVQLLHRDPVLGSSAGFLISAVVNYLLNYHFTFQSANSHFTAATRFAIISSAAFLLNGAIMFALVQSMHVVYVIAQLAATAAVLVWNFLGSALWTFARSNRQPHAESGRGRK